MTYAILNESLDIVENIAESYMAIKSNWVQVPIGMPVAIGDGYDGHNFYDQNGLVRVTHETSRVQERVHELEQDNILKAAQIQALSDRNDFLEDCIAEMAGMVYA